MSTHLNLKEIERKAFRSTYEDGLWDIYFGLIVICMSIFIYRPEPVQPDEHHPGSIGHVRCLQPLLGRQEIYHRASHGTGEIWTERKKKKNSMRHPERVRACPGGTCGLTTLGWLNTVGKIFEKPG